MAHAEKTETTFSYGTALYLGLLLLIAGTVISIFGALTNVPSAHGLAFTEDFTEPNS
jgi:hypothetical protein